MTTWVLLRGLMREQRHWGEFPALFQETMVEPDIVTLDFPGNGKLHAQASASRVQDMAEHCRRQLRASGHAPPYRVLALSLGAMVAVAWAQAYPEELEKLVLINTSLAPHNPFQHRLRPQNYPALLHALTLATTAKREALILRLTSKQAGSARAEDILQKWIDYARQYPIARANILRQLMAAMRYRAPDAAPVVPLLLLAGAQDSLVNPQCSIALAKKWHCALRLHPDAGHDLPLDDAVWVARQVKEWLESDAS